MGGKRKKSVGSTAPDRTTHEMWTKAKASSWEMLNVSVPTWLSLTPSTSQGSEFWTMGSTGANHNRVPVHIGGLICKEVFNRVWCRFCQLSLSGLALALLLTLEQSVTTDILTLSMACLTLTTPKWIKFSMDRSHSGWQKRKEMNGKVQNLNVKYPL